MTADNIVHLRAQQAPEAPLSYREYNWQRIVIRLFDLKQVGRAAGKNVSSEWEEVLLKLPTKLGERDMSLMTRLFEALDDQLRQADEARSILNKAFGQPQEARASERIEKLKARVDYDL